MSTFKSYYVRDEFREEIKDLIKVRRLLKDPRFTISLFNSISEERGVSYKVALWLSDLIDMPIDTVFEADSRPIIPQDITYLELSEHIITGLKRNIQSRLLVCNGKLLVDDIMELIDEIIKESSYLGVEAQKNNAADFIIKAAQKRRK